MGGPNQSKPGGGGAKPQAVHRGHQSLNPPSGNERFARFPRKQPETQRGQVTAQAWLPRDNVADGPVTVPSPDEEAWAQAGAGEQPDSKAASGGPDCLWPRGPSCLPASSPSPERVLQPGPACGGPGGSGPGSWARAFPPATARAPWASSHSSAPVPRGTDSSELTLAAGLEVGSRSS